jgi:HAD superfamily hydrolase (TIGR01484 family)
MTKLFVVDLDGCISMPFITPHWPSISWIRELNQLSRDNPAIPELSICTGRPFPYAEAVAQWLDVRQPIIFESGGGIYFPDRQMVEFSKHFYAHEQEVAEVRKWVQHLIDTEFPQVLLEFSKHTDSGVVHNDISVISTFYDRAQAYISQNHPHFEVHHTEVSVNVILRDCNKGNGLKRLSELTGVSLDEMAYIGDSSGDISALKLVGKPFAPSNAIDAVKAVAEVTQARTSLGVLEAYQKLSGR